MPITTEDRQAITDLISLHGHLADAGELDRMGELFTEDVVYDVSDVGAAPIHGRAGLKQAALALGAANPVAHHVTNIVLTEAGDDLVRARSKGLAVMTGGSCGSVTYDDTVVRGADGWHISHRKITARRTPLN